MSVESIAVRKAIDTTILVLLGDKIGAGKQREIRQIIEKVQAGDITEEEGYNLARFNDGDTLDQVLGNDSD